MIEVKFESVLAKIGADIKRFERRQRIAAANHVKGKIRDAATAIKKTGNLAKSTYARHEKDASFVGNRAPHNYLVEFGHLAGKKGSPERKFIKGNHVVYGTFEREADAAIAIMSEPVM